MLPPDRADAGLCVCASSRPPEDAHTRLSGDALRPHAMWLPTAWPSLPYSSAARPPSPPRWRAKARPRPPSPATARQPLPAGHLSPLLPSGSDPPNPPLPGPVPAVRPSARASRSSTAGLPPFFSHRASPLQPPSSASLAASLAATRARANRTPRSASSIAPRHGRLPSSGDASFDLLPSPTSNPPGRPDAGPCLAGPTPSSSPPLDSSLSQPSRPDSLQLRPSRLDLSSLWTNHRLLGWIRHCRGHPTESAAASSLLLRARPP